MAWTASRTVRRVSRARNLPGKRDRELAVFAQLADGVDRREALSIAATMSRITRKGPVDGSDCLFSDLARRFPKQTATRVYADQYCATNCGRAASRPYSIRQRRRSATRLRSPEPGANRQTSSAKRIAQPYGSYSHMEVTTITPAEQLLQSSRTSTRGSAIT